MTISEADAASCWWDHPELTSDERAGLDAALERVPEARLLEARTTRRLARGKLTHTSQPDAAARARALEHALALEAAGRDARRRRARDAAHFAASGARLLAPIWGGADAGGHALAYFEAALAAGPVDVDALVAQYELMLERTRARTEARARDASGRKFISRSNGSLAPPQALHPRAYASVFVVSLARLEAWDLVRLVRSGAPAGLRAAAAPHGDSVLRVVVVDAPAGVRALVALVRRLLPRDTNAKVRVFGPRADALADLRRDGFALSAVPEVLGGTHPGEPWSVAMAHDCEELRPSRECDEGPADADRIRVKV